MAPRQRIDGSFNTTLTHDVRSRPSSVSFRYRDASLPRSARVANSHHQRRRCFEKKDSLLSQQPFSNLIHCNIESREDKIANSPIS